MECGIFLFKTLLFIFQLFVLWNCVNQWIMLILAFPKFSLHRIGASFNNLCRMDVERCFEMEQHEEGRKPLLGTSFAQLRDKTEEHCQLLWSAETNPFLHRDIVQCHLNSLDRSQEFLLKQILTFRHSIILCVNNYSLFYSITRWSIVIQRHFAYFRHSIHQCFCKLVYSSRD